MAPPSIILDRHGFAVGWHGPLGPAVAFFETWSRAEPLFARALGTPGADLPVVPVLWTLDERLIAFWCEERGAFSAALARDGSAGEAVCVAEGARAIALAPGDRTATLFCADEAGIVRVDVNEEGEPTGAPRRCVSVRRSGAVLAAARLHDEALLAYVHRGAASFGVVATRGDEHVHVKHSSSRPFASVDVAAFGTRAALVLESGGELSLGLVAIDGKMIERPHPVLERHPETLTAPRVVHREDSWAVLARELGPERVIVTSKGESFTLPRTAGPFAATFWAQHYYALEVDPDDEGAELRLWRCGRAGEGQQRRVVRVVPSDAAARRTQLRGRRVLSALGARLTQRDGYRDNAARPAIGEGGCSLAFADEVGRVSLSLSPLEGAIRLRVVSTLGEEDLTLPEPPSSLVRLARWVKERVSPAAREVAERERAWGRELAALLTGTLSRLERAGATLVLELKLAAIPAAEQLDPWLRRLRREQRERAVVE